MTEASWSCRTLGSGRYVAPEPDVVGKGLASVQAGFDAQRQGVSARKGTASSSSCPVESNEP